MSHPRADIRHHVVDLLDSTFDGRAFRSRVYPMQRAELPGACIYAQGETSALDNMNRALMRSLTVNVDIYVRSTETPDDDLDDLCNSVEDVLAADPQLGGMAVNSWLSSTTIGFAGDGEKANGMARLSYTVEYRTKP